MTSPTSRHPTPLEVSARACRALNGLWVRRKDGVAFLADVRGAVVSDAQGTPVGLVGVSIEAFLNDIDPGDAGAG